jgi:hypothetical protein
MCSLEGVRHTWHTYSNALQLKYEAPPLPRRPRLSPTTALRRRLIRLSAEVYFHPYWARPGPAAGRPELVAQARARHHAPEEVSA